MNPSLEQLTLYNEDEDCLFATQLATASTLPMVLRTAVELDLLEIIAKAGKNAQLSSSEIVSHLPAKNPDAPLIIDRMLRLLASYNILTCTLVTDKDGHAQRLYGLAPVCKYLTKNEDGVSVAPFLIAFQSRTSIDIWHHLKDAVLEGGSPFYMEHGKHIFEFTGEYTYLFNQAMYNLTAIIMKKVLEKYKGFESLKELVDVGGGYGANLRLIISKYPKLKGINFDLPHVVKEAPPCPGVEHVGGDMFSKVPKGEVIFMKWILHDWSDEQCMKILKNCYDALPETGKVIVLESIPPELPENDLVSKNIFNIDMTMFTCSLGGKERTKKEFETLAEQAGFAAMKLICSAYSYWVMEFCKSA